MIRIGIYGATGYTGLELLRLLQRHPQAEIAWLTSEQSAGQKFGDVFTVPPSIGAHRLVASAEADLSVVDLVFCCLPHAVSLEWVAKGRAAGAKVVDLSADYRLKDPVVYEKTYGHAHTQPSCWPRRSTASRSFIGLRSRRPAWLPIPAAIPPA